MLDFLPFTPPFGFSDIECVGLSLIFGVVGYALYVMAKIARGDPPKWGE